MASSESRVKKCVPALVSVIVPCYNGGPYLQEAIDSIIAQTYRPLELCYWQETKTVVQPNNCRDDGSTDGSLPLVQSLKDDFKSVDIGLLIGQTEPGSSSKGPGYGRNKAVEMSSGEYLCFIDADDVMDRKRVELQVEYLNTRENPECVLLGSMFHREPSTATPRYTKWCNTITEEQLMTQCFRECTIIQPTWFCKRDVFDKVQGYDASGVGTAEDLDFFYRHLLNGGKLARVPKDLVMYRSVSSGLSLSVNKETIWNLRMNAIQKMVINKLARFGIWSAGKDGKKFYRSLSPENALKVESFYDIDEKKIQLVRS